MRRAVGLVAMATVLMAACSERPQVADTSGLKKTDAPPWSSTESSAYAAPGWNGGDQAAWAKQLHQRAQAQNDYVR